MAVDFAALRDARLQTHWAAQPLAAAADALLEPTPDDSHSNLDWTDQTLIGRVGVLLRPATLTLEYKDDVFRLDGRTLDDAVTWISEHIGQPITLRDYEMPDHPVAQGAAFDRSDREAFTAVSEWLHTGFATLRAFASGQDHATTVRLWPHHFDAGALIALTADADLSKDPSIGIGMSPGDTHIDQPYFYVNPYGVGDRPDALPLLPVGRWADSWFGAVLTAAHIADGAAPAAFLDDAVNACRQLIGGA